MHCLWISRSLGDTPLCIANKKFASVNASSESLLLGRHQWTFTEDTDRYIFCLAMPQIVYGNIVFPRCSNPYSTPMSLSGCTPAEFTCKDSSCVPMEDRCDGRSHCPDGSDEEDCRFIFQDIMNSTLYLQPSCCARQLQQVAGSTSFGRQRQA